MTSPRTARRLSRILAMLPWVIAHPGAAVDEVCERFGYSRRELAADLDLVFVCGLPGYGPGELMVAYIEDDRVVVETADYFAGSPRLSPQEALALLASGMAVLGSGQAPPELESAVEKLSQALLPEGELLTVDVAAEPTLVGVLREAAANAKVLRITYTSLSREETTVREVEPWGVFSSLGNWYLSGFCRSSQAERVFRVDRIREATPTGEEFTPPPEPPAPEVRYTPSEDDVVALIELAPPARWVAEYYPVEVVEETPERVVVRFSAYDPLVAARLLLRLGPHARLLKGAEVEATLSRLRKEILARYGAETGGSPS